MARGTTTTARGADHEHLRRQPEPGPDRRPPDRRRPRRGRRAPRPGADRTGRKTRRPARDHAAECPTDPALPAALVGLPVHPPCPLRSRAGAGTGDSLLLAPRQPFRHAPAPTHPGAGAASSRPGPPPAGKGWAAPFPVVAILWEDQQVVAMQGQPEPTPRATWTDQAAALLRHAQGVAEELQAQAEEEARALTEQAERLHEEADQLHAEAA